MERTERRQSEPEADAILGGTFQVSAGLELAAPASDSPDRPPSAAATTGGVGGRSASPALDDEWRRWIAENLMVGATNASVLHAMIGAGIPPELALREIDLAQQSPYLKGGALLLNRLKKRDWQLATYRKLNRLHPRSAEIPRRHRLPRQEFLEEYYSTNRPVIITGMIDEWPALKKWDLDYFKATLGDRQVEVQFGRSKGDNYEIEREKFVARLPFADFLEKIRAAGVTNDFYMTASNNQESKRTLAELWDDVVQIPEYLDGSDPLSGFLWIGPAGTVTPFHHDLTNNFMAQVIGRKRVRIAPSWDIPLMQNHYHVFSRIDGRLTPFRPAAGIKDAQILESILCPGEVLFLPIGSMHFVEALDISVTVSFTNFLFDNDFASFYTTYHAV
jgi:hypothetical protein